MSTETCCRTSAFYNLRRYDPIGRTMWIRDYFAGFTGFGMSVANYPCRCSIDLANDRVYVSGPLVYSKESDLRTWWNAACYTLSGNLLWKRRFGRDTNASGATDVVTVNGHHYIMVFQLVGGSGIPSLAGLSLCEFDKNGNQIAMSLVDGHIGDVGPRFLLANPDVQYQLIPVQSFQPKGITTFGWPSVNVAQSAVYLPSEDCFVMGVAPPQTGATWDIIWKTPTGVITSGGGGLLGGEWRYTLIWGIENNPHELFGIPIRVWIVPREMARAGGSDVICATDFSTYYLFNGDGVSDAVSLGSGSLARLDGDGYPVWFRGLSAMGCCASDDEGRLYTGTLIKSDTRPSIQRWDMDGNFIWGHSHNNIEQVAIVGDAGTVTVGNRVQYGVGEKNWLREGSFE